MPTRREFLKDVASGTAGLVLVPQAGGPVRRREVSVGGRRVKVVDVHGHCLVPEVQEVVKDAALAGTFKNLLGGGNLVLGPERLRYMDEQGIDVQAHQHQCVGLLADRDAGAPIVTLQNEKTGGVVCGASGSLRRDGHRWRCSIPTWRPSSSTKPSRSWDFAARRSAAASKAQELSDAQVRSVLGESGGARRHAVHAPAAGARHHAESTAAGQGRSRQHDRQSAGDDGVPLAPDFRRARSIGSRD